MEENNKRVYLLVKEEYEKMKFSKNFSNRAILSVNCQNRIYKEWGISNNNLWKEIDEIVESFISEEED